MAPRSDAGGTANTGRSIACIGWRPRRGAAVLAVAALLLGAFGTVAFASTSATKPLNLAGTWSGTYSGAFSGSFTLKWTQTNSRVRGGSSTLKGTIKLSKPAGTYGISGSVKGKTIKFGAVGVGAFYSGSVSASGIAMSGTWKSGQASGSWKAHRLLSPSKSKVKLP